MNNNYHDCADELREAKMKVTPARVALLKLIENHDTPLDSSHFIKMHKELGIDRVTVFRILNTLVRKGLVKKLEFQEGKARFEVAKTDHHHLICISCGAIEDIYNCDLKDLEERINRTGFQIKNHTLEFFGLCRACRLKN